MDPLAEYLYDYSPYTGMMNSPFTFNDPDGDIAPLVLIAIGAAVVNGGINVVSQALKGNVTSFSQGLQYFGVGAIAGVAYVVPGGGFALAGSIQAGGNKVVQLINGQFPLDDINNGWDVAGLVLEVGLDFATPALGANLGKGLANSTLIPLTEKAGWVTSVSGGGQWIKTGGAVGEIAYSTTLTGEITVAATRTGAKGITEGVGLVAARSSTATARSLGVAGERAVGIGSKTRIPSLTGTARYRIPDGLSSTTLTEVKNVSSLSYTRQLRDFNMFSQQTGRQFMLYTRRTTTFSGPLQNLINQGQIIVRPIPGF